MSWLEGASRGESESGSPKRPSRTVVAVLVLSVAVLVSSLTLAACGESGPYTTTLYTVTPSDPSHLDMSVAVFNGGNSPGTPRCHATATSSAGEGSLIFGPKEPIGTAKSTVLHETMSIPGGAAGSVGYQDVSVSCS